MSIITGNTVMGIFDDQGHAHQAVIELRLAGFRDTDMGIIASRSHRRESAPQTPAVPAVPENDAESLGAETLGAETLGALPLAPLTLPAVGPVMVGGFLLTLTGSAPGGVLGGLVCNLMGMGVPESHAREMERALLFSCTIVSVHTDLRQNEAGMILDWDGAQHDLEQMDPSSAAVPGECAPPDQAGLLFAQERTPHFNPNCDNPYRNRLAG